MPSDSERMVKEQTCLYEVTRILRDEERSLDDRLRAVVERIPEGWQHPESTIARLVHEERCFTSGEWTPSGRTLEVPLRAGGEDLGVLAVGYREERPVEDPGPFLAEERRLLDAIADRVAMEIGRERLLRRLEESEQRLRVMSENVGAVLYQWDVTTDPPELIYASSAYEEVWGRSREELYEGSYSFLDGLLPEDRQTFEEAFDERWTAETEMTYRIRRPNGEVRWIRDRSFPVESEEDRPERVVGLAEDVTEQHRLEQRLRQSNRDLEQFAYVASHDLQEPLRMVSGYLQLVEERYADRLDDDAREFIDYAVDGALRMKKMISDLLDFSRVSTRGEEPRPVEAGEALQRALSGLKAMAEEADAEVVHGELPVVVADESQLVRVFQNLVVNAIRHGGAGVRVEVTAERAADGWCLSVADDGPGIPADEQERIFRIFESLQRPDGQRSTGIGLAICRRIVERHGGRIWVESEPGEGATFHFTMPASARAPRTEEAAS